jgi:triacylglycerol lipase
MYFPKGFDVDRAIELGELVDQAYTQFRRFQKGEPWKPSGDYELGKELNYPGSAEKKSILSGSGFDLDLRSFRRAGQKNARHVPIGFIAQRGESIFLIFRGTMTDQEWIRNLSISLVPYLLPGFGKVHDGFVQTYELVRTEISNTLEGMNPKSRLFIAGHSLGGALATIALPEICGRTSRRTIALYTYGSPRVGDNAFVTTFNRQFSQRSFRIVNSSDLVGLIPPPAPILGTAGGYFSHVDTPVGFTVQENDVEKNHELKTYLSALRESRANQGVLSRLKQWFIRHG